MKANKIQCKLCSHGRGFTLIELLVVVAIIGILSAVILTALAGSRDRARVAAAQIALHQVQVAMGICLVDRATVNTPTMTNNGGGGAICAGSPTVYQVLPQGWIYCDASVGGGAGNTTTCNNSALNAAFTQTAGVSYRVSVYSSAALRLLQCNEINCTTQIAQ